MTDGARPDVGARFPRERFLHWGLVSVSTVIAALGVLTLVAVLSGGWTRWGGPVMEMAGTIATALLVVAIGAAIVRTTGVLRAAWATIAAMPVLNMAYTFAGVPDDGAPVWTEVLDSLAIAALIVGLVLMVVPLLSRRQLVRFILDALIAGGSTAFLLIAGFELGRSIPATPANADLALLAVGVMVLAVTVAVIVLLVIAHTRRLTPRWYRLVAGGILTVLLALLVAGLMALVSGAETFQPVIVFGSTAGWLLMALGAAIAEDWPDWDLSDPPGFVQWAVYVPFTFAILAAAFDYIEEGGLTPDLFFLAIAVITILTIRTLILLRENQVLTQRANESAAFKTQLLRFISHEMANPLSPLRLQLQVRNVTGKTDERGWEIMERSVARLESMSKDVRVLALSETGRLVHELEPHDLVPVLEDAVRSAEGLAERRDISMHRDLPEQPVVVAMDMERLGQVMDNLLSNAIKFTPRGGTVTVKADLVGDGVRVHVVDTGMGMTEDQKAGLFHAFSRLHGKEGPKGLGLGLYICFIIILDHGGTIEATSPGRGHGSTFTFALPVVGGMPMDDSEE